MNSKVSEYAVITDDPYFAASVTSYLYNKGEYVPILSLPRMNRDDWETEVLKRTSVINRFKIKNIFCKGRDYGLLGPFRKYTNAEITPLKKPSRIINYINKYSNDNGKLKIRRKDYGAGLILAVKNNRILSKSKKCPKLVNAGFYKLFSSKYLLVLEHSGSSSDIAAINYALANEFDILIINAINDDLSNEITNALINLANTKITQKEQYIKWNLNFLEKRISYIVDIDFIENNYEAVQFVTKNIHLGFLIDKIPAAHLVHLQSELNLLNEYYYSNKFKDDELPSFLFVDTQEPDLTSEIPELSDNLNQFKCFRFYLNGKHANLKNFKIYSHFFPYDVLFITGHGTSPESRIVKYSFKSSDGKEHEAKLIEYYRFEGAKGEMIGITRRWYPLEFDGIEWRDKKALKKAGIIHIMREFSKATKRLKLINSQPYFTNKIEGIQLADNVFMGEISSFERDNNPIVILNSCGSLVETGDIINFGLTRVLIGTLWPVFDDEAKSFAITLFNEMSNDIISNSFNRAKSKIKSDYTRYSYVMIGTLFQYLNHRRKVQNVEESKVIMGKRIANAINRAMILYKEKHIDSADLDILLKFGDMFDNFMERNCPTSFELRSKKGQLRKVLLTE